MGGVQQEGPGISTEGAVRELEVKWRTWWCKRKGGDIKTRELTGHKVDRYAQTDHICMPAELTYQTTHMVYTRSTIEVLT